MKILITTSLFLISLVPFPGFGAAEDEKKSLIVHSAQDPHAGLINGKTTLRDLEHLFGKKNLKKTTSVACDECVEQVTTEIHAKGFEANIVWNDKNPATADRIDIMTAHSLWHTAEGLRIGTPIEQLEKINGAPFQFSGLGWDNGGEIDSSAKVLSHYDHFKIILGSSVSGQDSDKFFGDKVNPMSNAAGIGRAKIHVEGMTLNFN